MTGSLFSLGGYLSLLKNKLMLMGALGIFVYVGAEVAIGSFLVNYFDDMNLAVDGFQEYANYKSDLTRTADSSGLLEENYFNFRLSLSLNDIWFKKRKID